MEASDKHHQLTFYPAGVTAKLKHKGGVFVALVLYCPTITIINGIFVIATEIFNLQQCCGDKKGSILVQNYNLDLLAQDKWLFFVESLDA